MLCVDKFTFLCVRGNLSAKHARRGESLQNLQTNLLSFTTGAPLVDAAMRELQYSGYLSNRLRQVVAGYWLNEMQGDWRAGAAWFEACLIDYDVYSNQGNWLYIAGRGSDRAVVASSISTSRPPNTTPTAATAVCGLNRLVYAQLALCLNRSGILRGPVV